VVDEGCDDLEMVDVEIVEGGENASTLGMTPIIVVVVIAATIIATTATISVDAMLLLLPLPFLCILLFAAIIDSLLIC